MVAQMTLDADKALKESRASSASRSQQAISVATTEYAAFSSIALVSWMPEADHPSKGAMSMWVRIGFFLHLRQKKLGWGIRVETQPDSLRIISWT